MLPMCPGRTTGKLARPEGLEPPAYWFEASRSIRLSYGRVALIVASSRVLIHWVLSGGIWMLGSGVRAKDALVAGNAK